MGRFEVIEHTADVGVAAWGETLAGLFEAVTMGLLEITGTHRPGGSGETSPIEVIDAPDLGAALVDWLSELLYLQDARDAVVTGIEVAEVEGGRVMGSITLEDRGDQITEGTPVKAVTYHQLSVEREAKGWRARVFFDI